MTKISEEQRQALAQNPEQPLALEDMEARRRYVLIEESVYNELVRSVQKGGASTSPPSPVKSSTRGLPDWCKVYAGLSDEDIRRLEEVIRQRADFARSS